MTNLKVKNSQCLTVEGRRHYFRNISALIHCTDCRHRAVLTFPNFRNSFGGNNSSMDSLAVCRFLSADYVRQLRGYIGPRTDV